MDEYTVDVFANRDEPLPTLTVTYDDVSSSSSELESKSRRSRLRKSVSATRLRNKAQELHTVQTEKIERSPDGRASIQDRLFAKVLQSIIPTEDLDGTEDEKVDRRSSEYVQRPSFSLPLMTNNFRRFNARIGIVFVFQNRMIRLFTWKTPSHTLSFLALYTFVCLDPYLLVVLPLAVCLLFVMVPAFIARHPPPPPPPNTTSTKENPYAGHSYSGPPIAPARTIRPAAETSKDFFRNMRDLQNSMADFSNLHDVLVTTVAPATNFSNEVLSSTLFLYLFLASCALFISAHLLPYRVVSLVAGYVTVILGHPRAQTWLVKQQKRAERKSASLAAEGADNATADQRQLSVLGISVPNSPTSRRIQAVLSSISEVTLSTAPEVREVEIFELQHRPVANVGSVSHSEWTPHLFTATPYDPLSPIRISGDRPKGTRFFEDVQSPEGWVWHSKKWELDLEAGEWVNERLVVGVEYDVMQRSGVEGLEEYHGSSTTVDIGIDTGRRGSINADFGGWVWDLPPAYGSTGNRDEEVWLAYGDYHIPGLDEEKEKKGKKKHKKETSKAGSERDWEEAIRYDARGRTGEWRRRRWVRLVRRREMDDSVTRSRT